MIQKPRSVMIYGESGSSKTSQLYHMAKYIHKLTGKKLRMIHSDPGGYAPFIDSGLIDRGVVEVFDYSARKHALADFRRLSEGYWPRWVKDGKVYTTPIEGSTEYFTNDPLCKTKEEEWGGIAGYLFDSLSSEGEILKNHCSDQDEGVGFKPSWKYEEDGYTITGLQEGHYGLVQKELHSRVTKGFYNLPVQWMVFTALVGKGEDKQKRETVYGPQVVGNASTPQAPNWFGDCLHLAEETYENVPCRVNPNANGEKITQRVAWFRRHLDDTTSVAYLCKARCAPEMFPKLLEYFPYGFVPLGFKSGIDLYFRVLDTLRKEMIQNES